MSLDSEIALFKEWQSKRSEFSPDGIIDFDRYVSSGLKIMLILKEVNNKQRKSVNLKEFLKKGAGKRKATWDNVGRWLYGIDHLKDEIYWDKLIDRNKLQEIRREYLPSICVMNMKKSPGGHTSINDDIEKIAKEDAELLNRQFNIYFNNPVTMPDLIICGGSITSHIFNAIINLQGESKWKVSKRGIPYYEYCGGKFFIQYSHPAARVSDNLLYYGLIDAIKELRKVKGDNK